MLYGILTLHKAHSRALSLPQLRDLLAKGQVAMTMEEAIPDVSRQLDRLHNQLESLTGDLYLPKRLVGAAWLTRLLSVCGLFL